MKELSIEEKAKAYDEAINVAKSKIKNDKDHVLYENDIIEIFPELKESEDERIKKGLLYVIEHHPTLPTEEAEEYIAWLEKQGEQKPVLDVEIPFGAKDSELKEVSYDIPKSYHAEIEDNKVVIKKGEQKSAEWSKEDEKMFSQISDILWEGYKNTTGEMPTWDNIKEWCLSIKDRVQSQPKQEWSEDDERIFKSITYSFAHNYPLTVLQIDFVKSLKDRIQFHSTWKPSDEEMKALEFCLEHNIDKDGVFGSKVVKLYDELKKLREE